MSVAIIGCGHWGGNLARSYAALDSLYGIVDENKAQAKLIANNYSVKNLTLNEAFTDPNIQGIVIATPPDTHAKIALEAISNGKHVFIEKPLALKIDDANKIKHALDSSDVRGMVGHLLHYHDSFIIFKKLILDGLIGDILYIHSTRKSFGKIRNNEDVVWSLAPHDISMVLSLTDSKLEAINAIKNYPIKRKNIADTAEIFLTFKNHLHCQISVSWVNALKEQKFSVLGSKGVLIFDDTQPVERKIEHFNHTIIEIQDGLLEKKGASSFIPTPNFNEPLHNECKHFLDIINNRVAPLTPINEGIDVLRILEKIQNEC